MQGLPAAYRSQSKYERTNLHRGDDNILDVIVPFMGFINNVFRLVYVKF